MQCHDMYANFAIYIAISNNIACQQTVSLNAALIVALSAPFDDAQALDEGIREFRFQKPQYRGAIFYTPDGGCRRHR